MKEIYFVSFYTTGDGCIDLTPIVKKVESQLSKYFTKMLIYNKEELKRLPNSEDICNQHKHPLESIYFFLIAVPLIFSISLGGSW